MSERETLYLLGLPHSTPRNPLLTVRPIVAAYCCAHSPCPAVLNDFSPPSSFFPLSEERGIELGHSQSVRNRVQRCGLCIASKGASKEAGRNFLGKRGSSLSDALSSLVFQSITL